MEKRRMCPNCRAFISIDDRICPYCEVQLGPRAVDMRRSAGSGSFMPHATSMSVIVLSVNCFIYLLEILVSLKNGGGGLDIPGQILYAMGAKFNPAIAQGEWWRLITAGLLHGGLLHIAMNSYALLILVTDVEQFYGPARLIVAYVVSTFTGFLLSFVGSNSLSIGASAAAFGLIGIMLAVSVLRRNDPLAHLVRAQYTQWIVFSIALSFFGSIDIWAHIGGAIGGFATGIVAGLPGLPRSSRERLWQGLAGVAVAITAWAILLDALSFRHLQSQG